MNKDDYVWYAVYGSNLSIKRFNKYIKGGKLITSCKTKEYDGCTCRNKPSYNKPYKINHELYFAKKSPTWCNHGVAFVKSVESKEPVTLGRIYLITKEQFVDILHQENGKRPPYNVYSVDFDGIIRNRIQVIGENGWYTRIFYLDNEEGIPILTFTGGWEDSTINNIRNFPSRQYRNVIIKGLLETYPKMNILSVCQYLYKMGGINYHEKNIKVRKEWDCFQCPHIIQKGEWATVHTFYGGGKKIKNYYCEKCKPIINRN
jgi:hypothetical protein